MVLRNRYEESGDLKGLWGSVKGSLVGHALCELRCHFSLGGEGMENVPPYSWAPLVGVRGRKRGSFSPCPKQGGRPLDVILKKKALLFLARWVMYDGTN